MLPAAHLLDGSGSVSAPNAARKGSETSLLSVLFRVEIFFSFVQLLENPSVFRAPHSLSAGVLPVLVNRTR